MIQCYYGNGKGKTCSSVGCAMRAAGSGMKVLFVQFFKNDNSSEISALREIKKIDTLFPTVGYKLFESADEKRINERKQSYCELLFNKIPMIINNYQMVIFDELLDAVEFGYVDKCKLIELFKDWKISKEIVITGHKEIKEISDISDYLSEIKEIKHPYNSGVAARKGIEY